MNRTLEIEMYRKNLENMVSAKVNEITRIQGTIITGIANLIESRDGSTGMHVKNTTKYVELLTKELQRRNMYPEILTEEYADNTIRAAALHDVGKIKNIRFSFK